jgi:hypothetical protein
MVSLGSLNFKVILCSQMQSKTVVLKSLVKTTPDWKLQVPNPLVKAIHFSCKIKKVLTTRR